jgi:hypothetical protein
MQLPRIIMDRSAVLLLGVCAGTAIGLSFTGKSSSAGAAVIVPACQVSGASRGDAAPEVRAARQCAAAPQRQLRATIARGAPVQVAVFGDSFGDGVWWALQHQLPSRGYAVTKYSQPATGFTRYKRLNLEAHTAEQLGDGAIDIAVISFGANDVQGIITDKGGYAPLMGPKWQAQIGERLDRFVALLRKHHAMVYWIGLPRMREAGTDADIGAINAFYAARMARLGVPFVDTRPLAADAKGAYAAYLPDPKTGRQVLVREGDGIHMSMPGYLRITRGLADRIRDYVDATRAMQDGAAAPASGR